MVFALVSDSSEVPESRSNPRVKLFPPEYLGTVPGEFFAGGLFVETFFVGKFFAGEFFASIFFSDGRKILR
jgi:hypothetical protein